MHLENDTEGGPGPLLGPVLRTVPRASGREPRQLDPQGDPYARVVTGGDIGGPGALLGQPLRPGAGERRAGGGRRRGGCARQPVRDRVEERAQQPLGGGQPERPLRGVQRYCVRAGRHRSRQFAHPFPVLGGERSGPPGVVIGGAQARQQPPVGDELERDEGSRTPEGGGRGGVRGRARPGQYRQSVPYRQHKGPYGPCGDAVRDDGQFLDGAGEGGRPAAVGAPEGDLAGACRVRRQEDRGAADEFGDPGERCRRRPVHSDAESLKFD